ncbi:MAG: hypothetical protein WA188_13475 [Terriglobales bacterium]
MDVQAIAATYDLQMVYKSIAARTRVLLDCVRGERENQRIFSACWLWFFGWLFLHTASAMLMSSTVVVVVILVHREHA